MESSSISKQPPSGALIDIHRRSHSENNFPLPVETSEGSWLTLTGGRKLLDCDCNGGVFSLGHRNPAVKAALERALGRYDMGNHHLISEPKGKLAKRLAELLPEGLVRAVFNVTRSEAVDAAIKLARGASGKPGIISADCAFHGSDGFALAASDPKLAESLRLEIPGFFHIPYNNLESLKQKLAENRGRIAAVILEPAAVEAGAIVPGAGYLRKALALCRKADALLIVDESATGFGRSGELFAVNREGVSPDILITGAALGGGLYPIHATCHRESLDRFYVKNPFIHISTFGGSELGCFAAMAALEQLSSRALMDSAQKQSRSIAEALAALHSKHPDSISAVRSFGLLFGVELVSAEAAQTAQSLLLKYSVFCRRADLNGRVILLLPPLNIRNDETQQLIASLESAVSDLARNTGGGS